MLIDCKVDLPDNPGMSFFSIYEKDTVKSMVALVKGEAESDSNEETASQDLGSKSSHGNIPEDIKNIDLLRDVLVDFTVELGRTKKQIQDILAMGEGTIIELEKLADEPVDILVNRKLIARGEVVIIDENYGVRITEILSPREVLNLAVGS